MTWFGRLRSRLQRPARPAEWAELLYVYLPMSIMPIERGDRFEDALDTELKLTGLGEVSGGGSQLGDENSYGTRPILFCGIDVSTNDVVGVRNLLRDLLPRLHAPAGSRVHFRANGRPACDEYDGQEWTLDKPADWLHPAFG